MSTKLLSRVPAIRLRSDIERKRQLGLGESDSTESAAGGGIYTDAAKADVYRRLLDSADQLLNAGFNVIVDASFLRRADRDEVATVAARGSVEHVIIETVAGAGVLRPRLTQREKAGVDASEADVEVLEFQRSHFDPLNDNERRRAITVATDGDVGVDGLVKSIRELTHQ